MPADEQKNLTSTTLDVSDVEEIENRTVYQGYARVTERTVRHRLYNGNWSQPIKRELFESGDAVVVLPYDPSTDEVVLVEQFRISSQARGIKPWLLECIAGRVAPGETADQVALREAKEEAGCDITDLTKIGEMFMSPGIFAEYATLYCARVNAGTVSGIHGLDVEHEDIRPIVASFDDAMAALGDGRILTSPPFVCLQWLALHRDRLRQQWAGLDGQQDTL